MKRPRREGGGGEIALMAVITKAMGAFLVLVVIMLPHYVFVLSQNKSAEAAQKKIDQAMQTASAVAEALKKGRLTDLEIDQLIERLKQLSAQLDELRNEVASLKNELDQSHAEIARLSKAKQALEEEVARLRKEIEQLRDKDIPVTVATMSWSECPGGRIEIYLHSDVASSAGKMQPGAERRSQGVFWPQERVLKSLEAPHAEAGHATWVSPDRKGKELLTVWAKLMNPLPLEGAIARRCLITGSLSSRNGSFVWSSTEVTDTSPLMLLFLAEKGEDGQLRPDNSSARSSELRRVAYSAPCDGLLCAVSADGRPVRTADDVKAMYISFVQKEREISLRAAEFLFTLMSEKTITVADGYRWLSLFPQQGSETGPATGTSDTSGAARAMMSAKGAPPWLSDEIAKAVKDGRLALPTISTVLDHMTRLGVGAGMLETKAEAAERGRRFDERRSMLDKLRAAINSIPNDTPAELGARTLFHAGIVGSGVQFGVSPPSDDKIDELVRTIKISSEAAQIIKQLIKNGDVSLDAVAAARDKAAEMEPAFAIRSTERRP